MKIFPIILKMKVTDFLWSAYFYDPHFGKKRTVVFITHRIARGHVFENALWGTMREVQLLLLFFQSHLEVESSSIIATAIIIIIIICEFFTSALADGLSLESGDSKAPQVSQTLLNNLADLNNAVIWMRSARVPISNSPSLLPKPLRIIPSAPIVIGITVNFLSHSFFTSLARSKYLSLFYLFIYFWFPLSVVSRDGKVHHPASLFVCFFALFFFCYHFVLEFG